MYEDHLDKLGEEPRKMFTTLAQKLQEEVQLMMTLAQLEGTLQVILSVAEAGSSTAMKKNQSMKPSDAAQTQVDLVLNIT